MRCTWHELCSDCGAGVLGLSSNVGTLCCICRSIVTCLFLRKEVVELVTEHGWPGLEYFLPAGAGASRKAMTDFKAFLELVAERPLQQCVVSLLPLHVLPAPCTEDDDVDPAFSGGVIERLQARGPAGVVMIHTISTSLLDFQVRGVRGVLWVGQGLSSQLGKRDFLGAALCFAVWQALLDANVRALAPVKKATELAKEFPWPCSQTHSMEEPQCQRVCKTLMTFSLGAPEHRWVLRRQMDVVPCRGVAVLTPWVCLGLAVSAGESKACRARISDERPSGRTSRVPAACMIGLGGSWMTLL